MKRGQGKKLDMRERRVFVKAFSGEYRKASKKEKGAILDRFVKATDYHRGYGSRLLRNHGRRLVVAPGRMVEGDVRAGSGRRGRRRIYGPEVTRQLKRMWQMLDYLCGKRLVAAREICLPPRTPRWGNFRAVVNTSSEPIPWHSAVRSRSRTRSTTRQASHSRHSSKGTLDRVRRSKACQEFDARPGGFFPGGLPVHLD